MRGEILLLCVGSVVVCLGFMFVYQWYLNYMNEYEMKCNMMDYEEVAVKVNSSKDNIYTVEVKVQ